MPENKQKLEPVPSFASIEEASDWWDEHSVGDYWDTAKEVHIDVQIDKIPRYVVLDVDIAKKIRNLAQTKGISTETLINLWLREKIETSA